MLRATDAPDDLKSRIKAVRDLAARRLVEAQSPDGSWPGVVQDCALPGAVFIIMLRTTGLIGHHGQMEIEAGLLRGIGQFQNPDGGFWKYEGARSSPLLSQICHAAIRLALGEIRPPARPADWLRKNPRLTPSDEAELRDILLRSESFCARTPPEYTGELETDLLYFSPLIVAHATGRKPSGWRAQCRLAFLALATRVPGLFFLSRVAFHRLIEAMWPATVILIAGLNSRAVLAHRMHRVVHHILGTQGEAGGWEIGSLITMLNIMALTRAGRSANDPAIVGAHAWLTREFLCRNARGLSLVVAKSHVLSAGYGLDTLVRAGSSLENGGAAGRALDFLLSKQTASGGFCFGSGLQRDAEADSTAHVVRSFPAVAARCDAATAARVRIAFGRGVASMLSIQHFLGGFSCYKRSWLDGHRGSSCVVEQVFFDLPTADVTARILETLVDAGMGADHPAVRKALGFLLRTQCANGGWWSRWWAGYLVGASFVLRAYAKLGLGVSGEPHSDPLLRRSHAAMRRAVEFLLGHQNADGGWGETTAADADMAIAGIGRSTPLHTAHITSSLLRIGYSADDPAILRAMRFLLSKMSLDGRWDDRQVTFSFLARCSYYRYDFLNLVLPLDALNDYLERAPRISKTDESPCLPSARRHASSPVPWDV